MLPGLKVKIGADTTELDKKLAETREKLRKFAAIAGAALAAASAGMIALTRSTAQAANEITILAQVANTTPAIMQRWAAGSATVGIEQDKLADILKDVNDRVGDFLSTGGGPMADFFENIAPKVGVTADQFARLSGPEALQLYVDSLEKAGLNQQEMTFYLEAMASDATRLIPLLRNGGEEMNRFGDRAEALGFVLDQRATQALQKAQIALIGAQQAITGVANQLASALAPAVEAMANAFTNLMMAGNPFRDLLNAIFDRIPAYLSTVTAFAAFMAGKYVAALVAARVATMTFAASLVAVRAALIRTGLGALVVLLGEVIYQITQASEKVGGFGTLLAMIGDIFVKAFNGMIIYAGSWKLKFEAFGKDIQSVWVKVIAFLAKKWSDFLSSIAPAFNRVAEQIGVEGIDTFGAEAYASMLESAASNRAIEADRLREQADQMAGGAFDGLVESTQRFMNALRGATSQSQELTESTVDLGSVGSTNINATASAAKNLTRTLTEAQARAKSAAEMIGQKMEEAFMSMVDGTMSAKDAFKSMTRSIIAELYRIFVVKRITGFITNAIGTAFGVPAAAMAPAAVSYEGGGYTGNGPRSGGVDGRGGFPAIVHPNETIVDHKKGNRAIGSPVIVNQTINVSTGVQQTVRNEIMQMMPQIAQSAKSAVVDAKRRGGSYGRAFA